MTRSSLKSGLATFLVVLMAAVGSLAYAQGGGSSTTLSGTISDTSGGIMPGVDVTAKHNGTGATFNSVSDTVGRFSIPSIPPGTYTVTVSLSGFKTVVLPDIQLVTGTPQSVKVTLEVGQLQETVVVTGAAEIVQTQTAEVQTTVSIKQISSLPVVSRTALDYVVSLPGVETPGSVTRSSTINGLPTTSMNITLDGVNVQDKRGSEGFFMFIRPLMDSVEEITVSTSNPGAESSGSGASQIRMTTRAGTNRFSGSIYNTWRNQAGTNESDVLARKNHPGWLWGLNTPYWFNVRDLPKTAAGDYFINDTRLQTPGFRVGGPILKDKLFYFFNYEEFRLPESRSRTRYLLNESSRAGIFTYPAADGSGNKTINLLALAAAKGQTATTDPSIAKLLGDIRSATGSTGAVSAYDVLTDKFDYSANATQMRKFPTVRMDYNLTASQRVSFVYRYNDFNSTPDLLNSADPVWPGFPNQGAQTSGRYMFQGSLRSTIGKNMVNELRLGGQDTRGLGSYFGKGVNESMFNCTGAGCQSAGGKGWSFSLPSTASSAFPVILNGATAYSGPSAGVAAQLSVEDTFNWMKGKHSISTGFSYTQIKMRNWGDTMYDASLSFGTASVDSVAYSMLDPASGNFPGGISTLYSGYARSLYGLLTGRVTSFSGTGYLQPNGSYVLNGENTNGTTANDVGVFLSDSWRMKPNLTLNFGARWEFQLPMTTDGLYSRPETWQMVYGVTGAGSGLYGSGNLYKPGTLTGVTPTVVKYENARPAYNTDWNNIAPSIGAAWRPNLKKGFLSTILSTDPVFRGGYSLSFTKLGTNFFDGNYSGNPGRSRSGTRTTSTGTPLLGVDTIGGSAVYPVLLRDTTRLFSSQFPASISYPLTPASNETLDIHYPDWPVPYTHQYSFGFQRALGKTMALELRYVGNTNVGGWTTFNMTANAQWSMLKGENGFYDEFRLAQQNLRANIAAGKGNTFAYTGAAGTSPLPIFMAYLQGIPLADARNLTPANYTASQFASSSWYNSLSMYSPALTSISGTGTSGLQSDSFVANAAKAGLPVNFFQANPAMKSGNAYLETTAGNTRFNSLQADLRKQLSKGLLLQGSYTYSFGRKTWTQRSLREDWFYSPSTGGPDHSFKASWAYELPFGQGKQIGSGVGRWMEALIGGWEWDGVVRMQSGTKFNYGGYRLVGMSEQEFADLFSHFYHIPDATTGLDRLYMLPKDVIEQSIVAIYQTSPTTTTGYTNNVQPTGRYIAPASGPDCVQYLSGMCPGTAVTRIVRGPNYFKTDMSFVKRFSLPRNMKIEARMDLLNVFNTINFNATSAMGSSFTAWQVTSAAQDVNGSQDPGGRITSFGLRFIW
jgi:hypothetical protein